MTALPSGTVTFLFTDIEGSTRLWEQHPAAMKQALARHDALLRQAIKAHEGYVFKLMGDAFCAAFHTAPQALAAALPAWLIMEAIEHPAITIITQLLARVSRARSADAFEAALAQLCTEQQLDLARPAAAWRSVASLTRQPSRHSSSAWPLCWPTPRWTPQRPSRPRAAAGGRARPRRAAVD